MPPPGESSSCIEGGRQRDEALVEKRVVGGWEEGARAARDEVGGVVGASSAAALTDARCPDGDTLADGLGLRNLVRRKKLPMRLRARLIIGTELLLLLALAWSCGSEPCGGVMCTTIHVASS